MFANRTQVEEKNNEKHEDERNQWSWQSNSNQESRDKLPSFGDTFVSFNYTKKPEESIAVQHVENVDEKDAAVATIWPGVIRHTSRPDTSLAYYYKYRVAG